MRIRTGSVIRVVLLSLPFSGLFGQTVTFRDIAGLDSGLVFERVPSERYRDVLERYEDSRENPLSMMDLPVSP